MGDEIGDEMRDECSSACMVMLYAVIRLRIINVMVLFIFGNVNSGVEMPIK